MSKTLLALTVAVVVFCGYMIFDMMRLDAKRKKSLRERIRPDGNAYEEAELSHYTPMSGDLSPLAVTLTKIMRSLGFEVEEAALKLELQFVRAGIDSKDGPIYYFFFQRVLSLALATLAGLIIWQAGGDNALTTKLLGGIILIGALFGPKLYLKNKIDRRSQSLQQAFPDTLDLLLICVESGLALDAALGRVCNELARAYPEMTQELNRTRLELALLNDRVRALMNLGERTGMVAFRSLVVALVQSERFGTSLSDTLRVLSEDFRLQRLARAEAKAARIPVLITIPLMLLLMPAFMIIILGPSIIAFMTKGQMVTGR